MPKFRITEIVLACSDLTFEARDAEHARELVDSGEVSELASLDIGPLYNAEHYEYSDQPIRPVATETEEA